MRQLALIFAAAVAFGYLFDALGVPVGWLLGPMAAGVLYVTRTGRPRPLHPRFQMVGQAILGVSTGVGFPLATLQLAAVHGLPLMLAVVVTGSLSLLNGYLLWRWAGVDRATGFMGSLPGAASTMVAMSDEIGADSVLVAVLQYLRMILVVFLSPAAVGAIFPAQAAGTAGISTVAALPAAPWWLAWLVMLFSGFFGTWAGRRLKLPAPGFLGPFLVALPLSWSLPYAVTMPSPLFSLGLLLMGIFVGVRFDLPLARRLGKVALIESVLVAGLIGISLGIGYLFHLWTGVDTMTAVLGSTPGGMEVMVASALQLGGDPGLVLAMQMTRYFIILLAGPWATAKLAGRAAA